MLVEVEKKDLISLLGKTQAIVEKRNTMPILVNVLLEVVEAEGASGRLKVFATDLEVSLNDDVPVIRAKPGRVAVNAKNLFDIVKELAEGSIQLLRKENNWLEIRQNKSVFNIVGISAEEYPVFPTFTTKEFMKIDSSVLADMIEKTIYSVSSDETRYHLNGVYFEKNVDGGKDVYRMVATDGHRLSLVDRKAEVKGAGFPSQGVIIPRKGLQEIKKLLESVSGQFEMAVEGSQLIVRHGSTVLMVRLIEGKYPNYQQLIPQNLGRHAHVHRETLLASLKRVSLLSNQKYKGVTLTLSTDKLEISSNNPELGDAKEEIEIRYAGSEIKIGFNARYILDVLNSFEDAEVDIDLNDQLSPGLIRPHQDGTYTCVVMPMRI
jgi:DNA polymerase-3 subunit beta